MHQANKSIKIAAIVDDFVENYSILDNLLSKGLLHVYAVRIDGNERKLTSVTLKDDYSRAQIADYPIDLS